jgi:hypothetical protein
MSNRMSKREFFGHLTRNAAIVAFAGGTSFALGGCSVLQELETWVPIGLTAFDEVVSLLNPLAGSALAVALTTANGLWTAFTIAISNYDHSTLPKATLLQRLIAAIGAFQDGLDGILATLPVNLPAAVLLGVKAGLKLLISTLTYFSNKYGGATVPSTSKTARKAEYMAVKPLPNPKEFAAAFNALGLHRADGSAVTIQ